MFSASLSEKKFQREPKCRKALEGRREAGLGGGGGGGTFFLPRTILSLSQNQNGRFISLFVGNCIGRGTGGNQTVEGLRKRETGVGEGERQRRGERERGGREREGAERDYTRSYSVSHLQNGAAGKWFVGFGFTCLTPSCLQTGGDRDPRGGQTTPTSTTRIQH